MSLKYNDSSNVSWDVAFHPKSNKPLDARSVVAKKTDLTTQNTWGNANAIKAYKGLLVFCEEDNATYVFIGSAPADVTNSANWKKVGSGDSGVPLLDTTKLNDIDEIPDYYVSIPNPNELDDTTKIGEGVTVSTGTEGTYLDILFQAIRKLLTEVTRLSNTFKKGIVSYTDTNTASTLEFITSKEEEIQEPLWTISQDDMTTLEEVNLDSTGESDFSPERNVSSSEGTYLQIGDPATHDYSGEVGTDSYALQGNYIIVQQSSLGNLECKNILSNDTTIDYTSLYSSLTDKTRYNIFTLLGRHEKEASSGSSSYENYVYISITNSADTVVKQGYLKGDTLLDTLYLFTTTDLLYFKLFTGANCYLYSLLTGSRDCGYSNYTDIPQTPDDSETFSYKAAHITIRSVKDKSTLESIKNRLLSNELIWVEDTSKLYILTNNNLIQIGSSTAGDSDSDDSGKTDTMADIAQWLKDEKLITGGSTGEYYLNSARLNDISSVTFKHEGSGKIFNISIQTDGTLKPLEIKKSLTAETTPANPAKGARGAVARYTLGEQDYTKTTFIVSSTTKSTTIVKGDRVRISKWYVPILTQTTYNCSHDFIELANSGTVDYPLDNAYLHLCVVQKDGDGNWTSGNNIKYEDKVYKLSGYIPAQGTYLIRAKQRLDVDSDVAYIKVDSYDIELWNNSQELQDLCNVLAIIILNGISAPLTFVLATSLSQTLSIYDSSSGIRSDVVDVVVLNANCSDSPFSGLSGATYKNTTSNTLQKDLYFLDPAKQAFKTLGTKIAKEASLSRTAKVDAENIVLNSDTIEFYHSSETKPVSLYKPHASYENANVCTDKSRLDINKPNAINCAFGINGWTTRCFNWVSVGENDEYIWVREKQSSSSAWSKSNRFESYKSSDAVNSTQSSTYPRKRIFSEGVTTSIYARLTGNFPANGQHYTAHKIVLDIVKEPLSNVTTYEYIVGRSHLNGTPNLEHCSDIRTFTLYPPTYTPVVIQTTDLQGFTWMEYLTWAAAANYIHDTEILNSCFGEGMANFPVLLNTGDMTLNGTRVNEWLDYFNAADCLFSKYEFMHVVGNNDLVNSYNAEFLGTGDDDGKSSPYYFHVFFCYEVDDSPPEGFPTYSEEDSLLPFLKKWQHPLIYNNIYVPSLYYFGFPVPSGAGKGFLMVNSEITEITCSVYFLQNHLNLDTNIAGNPSATTCTYNLYTGHTGKRKEGSSGSSPLYIENDKWCLKQTILWMLTQVLFTKGSQPLVSLKNVIVACHEMPFTVITDANLKTAQQTYDRSFDYASSSTSPSLVGSHLNVLGFLWLSFDETYWFSKLLQNNDIKLCIGGHKHSYCSTYPIHEYSENDSVGESCSDNNVSRKCTIYIKLPASYSLSSASDYHAWNTSTEPPSQAVVYFMCQATGYKQKSNKELPGPALWFSKILPDTVVSSSTADNTQCFPMYAVFTYANENINIALKRIANILKEIKNSSEIAQLNETSIVLKDMVAETCLLAWDSSTSKYKPYWYSNSSTQLEEWLNRVTYSSSKGWTLMEDSTPINLDTLNPDGVWNNTSPITDSVSLS